MTHDNICLAVKGRGVARLFVCFALLTGVASAQLSQKQPADALAKDSLAAAMDRLSHGTFFRVDINRVAEAGAVKAIPDLEKQFSLTQDEASREAIASVLVRLGGDKEGTYWDYLVTGALSVIDSDAPNPVDYDSKGNLIPGPAPEFVAWAKSHGLKPDAAETAATLDSPGKVLYLGESRDQRAIPLLQRALSSPNFMIETFAAQGLEKLQSKASIPLIIEACRRAPAGAAGQIAAFSLARFDDPVAKNAAKEFMPVRQAK
ncbi:MAG TPA: HEAT repeat domain-containing protein [Bryobacteraceae bacterium]|jgi:HEAT repeat protein|nr:HEAT repeat domain-containing protein [Bryobacteraceae bacterium]